MMFLERYVFLRKEKKRKGKERKKRKKRKRGTIE